ncbi:unnamed protein product [Anisakis simplex]|uniref:non-specific serine/threonine protein kinase n=1 Tax=Anisakis simplex TaxID=6269 RepID=A0A0M3J5L5_ANISI|nr:unnamed protein product [Anisakis simplex]
MNQFQNRTIIRVGDEGSQHSGVSSHRSDSSLVNDVPPSAPAGASVSAQESIHRPINDEMATLRRSRFSTLRTTKLISKEMEEHNRENNIYEQMSGYKRLRQQHRKELKQLEERCAVEMEMLKQKTDKEYEQLINNFSKELQRVRNSQNAEKDKKSREFDDMEKKMRRQLTSQQENELKAFSNAQKKEYKYNKERAKSVCAFDVDYCLLQMLELLQYKSMYKSMRQSKRANGIQVFLSEIMIS